MSKRIISSYAISGMQILKPHDIRVEDFQFSHQNLIWEIIFVVCNFFFIIYLHRFSKILEFKITHTLEQCLKSQRPLQSRSHPLLFSGSNTKRHVAEQQSCRILISLMVPKQSYESIKV